MNETRPTRRASRRTTEEAAHWHLEMREMVDASTQERFLAWLRRSPQHVAEYLAIAQLHGEMRAAALAEIATLDELRALADREPSVVPFVRGAALPVVQDTLREHGRRRSAPVWTAVAASLVLVTVGAVLAWPLATPAGVRYAANANDVRRVTLEDDTDIQLSPGSVMIVRFDNHTRHIELVQGNASFDIGKDPARPMSVMVGNQRIDDVGTVFDVSRGLDATQISVLSGSVTVSDMPSPWLDRVHRRLTGAAWPRERIADLHGGEAARIAGDGRLLDRGRTDTATAAAWLPAEIGFHGSSVAEVARRFNAYTATPLSIDDPVLAGKRISGVFHARDPEAFISYLGSLPDVRVVREPDRIRFIAVTRRRAL